MSTGVPPGSTIVRVFWTLPGRGEAPDEYDDFPKAIAAAQYRWVQLLDVRDEAPAPLVEERWVVRAPGRGGRVVTVPVGFYAPEHPADAPELSRRA